MQSALVAANRWAALVCAMFLAVVAGGCVRSKVVITSTPPGSDVMMNDVHVGQTPVEVPFTWYWYYDFKGEKAGYEPAYERHRFRAPFYLWPGFDLLMEAMPFPVRDTKYVHLELEEESGVPDPVYVDTGNAGTGRPR